jgi:hypothetical protein
MQPESLYLENYTMHEESKVEVVVEHFKECEATTLRFRKVKKPNVTLDQARKSIG